MLLIACVNVANLLLGRADVRQNEIAVRRALGASGTRLARQWMTEAAVLASLGGAAGVVVSRLAVSVLKVLGLSQLPRNAQISVDARGFLFALAISGVVCLLFGLAPSFAAIRISVSLRGSRPTRRTSRVLVTAEVALAMVLLIGAGLLLKSFARLRHVDPGFQPDRLLTMRVQFSGERYRQPRQRVAFFSELKRQLSILPGVVSASTVSRLPVASIGSLAARGGNPFSVEGHFWDPNVAVPQIAHTQTVGLDYFRTMRIPLLVGRDFSEADSLDAGLVTVVNETLASRYFHRGEAIGHRLLLGAPHPRAPWMTIVGIVADVKTGALDQAAMPQFYLAEAQDAPSSMTVVIRTAAEPAAIARDAARIVRRIDPDQPVSDVSTAEQRIAESVGEPRYQAELLGAFAGTALFLAAVGIYGVVARATIQRTKEIGIRMALGADASRVVTSVLSEGLRPVAAGIALGLMGGAVFARLLAGILFSVAPYDPATLASAVAVLAAIAAAACLVPARRAALLDPLVALREE